MPYSLFEDKIAKISPQYREELGAFLDFLIFKQEGTTHVVAMTEGASLPHGARRRAGGLGGEFYMAPDFDAPLKEFAEYM